MKKLSVLSMVLAFSAPAFADVAADVRCREIGFSKSVETKDAELFASYIDADARFVSNTIARGPDAVAEAWSVFFGEDGPTIKWRPQIVEVLEDGKLALSRGPYRYTAENEEGVATDYWGTFNSIWRLQDDASWKVVFDAGSPAAQAPADEIQALLEQDDDCES